MTRRKRLCLLLAVLTLLLALSACGAQSKLMLATTGMEPTLDLTLPDTITLPDKGRDTVYKSYVDKAYSMHWRPRCWIWTRTRCRRSWRAGSRMMRRPATSSTTRRPRS